MGLGAKILAAAALATTLIDFNVGLYIGHYASKKSAARYEQTEKQSINMLVDNRTSVEYVQTDMTNILNYLSRQDPGKLEEALKNEH